MRRGRHVFMTMTPQREGRFYEFRGTGTLLPLNTGVVPQSVASLTGLDTLRTPVFSVVLDFDGVVRLAA